MSLELKNVCYRTNNKHILENINLSLDNGIHVLLGLNGSGKTTLMKILVTLIEPSEGDVFYKGESIKENYLKFRKEISFLSHNIGLIQDFTVKQNLYYFGLLKGCDTKYLKSKIESILHDYNLLMLADTKIIALSGGVKQRLGIALALINNPNVLVLDEPVNNLDYNEREKFYFMLKERARNSIIIISTHILDEIVRISDKIIFIKNGKLTFFGNANQSIAAIKLSVNEEIIEQVDYAEIVKRYKLIKLYNENNMLRIRHFVSQNSHSIEMNIEDAFAYYTKHA